MKNPYYALKKDKIRQFQQKMKSNATKPESQANKILKKCFTKVEFQKIFMSPKTTFIVDFYLPVQKVIIEIDGAGHNKEKQKNNDIFRDTYFRNKGIKVIRVKNADVMKTDFVLLVNSKIKKPPQKTFPEGYIRIHEQNDTIPKIYLKE